MGQSAWAGVLMVVIAVLLAAGFVTVWIRDRRRSQEVSEDPGRAHTDTDPYHGATARRERD